MPRLRKVTAILAQLALTVSFTLSTFTFSTAAAKANGGHKLIKADELKEWLSYLASDEFEGRNTYTEGLGLAAGYIAGQLKSWGVKPGGPNGSYFQRVSVLGVKSANHSSLTVEVNGQTRAFKNKEGVNFPANVGGKRSFKAEEVEFTGYGLNLPGRNDYAGKNVKGKVVVFLGATVPKDVDPRQSFRAMLGRPRNATEQEGAVASIGPTLAGRRGQGFGNANAPASNTPAPNASAPNTPPNAPASNASAPNTPPNASAPGGGNQQGATGLPDPDFTTVQRLDSTIAPNVSGQDDFFEFLFSGADVKYAELKEKAAKGEPLPSFALKNVHITFNIDADYEIVRTQYTRNVIGIIEGSDAKLKDTYVAFGAHYDHVGYAEGEVTGGRRAGARGRVTEGAVEDRIWNGADDDGSGTVAILGVAKAFALGPKPRRSLLFVWHSGEEKGLLGSRYFADYPVMPMDKLVAQVNIDMIGRDRDNKKEEANTVYPVGSDRISTEFHNITVDANDALEKPLKLDYEMNDPSDLEQVYYRSDHYSYAAKGVPIVFLTTGLHPDYHANTDSAEKINYEKFTRIAQYTYEIGARAANLDHAPARDNLGPRVGRTVTGKLKL
jgi:peptidase M28-like protein